MVSWLIKKKKYICWCRCEEAFLQERGSQGHVVSSWYPGKLKSLWDCEGPKCVLSLIFDDLYVLNTLLSNRGHIWHLSYLQNISNGSFSLADWTMVSKSRLQSTHTITLFNPRRALMWHLLHMGMYLNLSLSKGSKWIWNGLTMGIVVMCKTSYLLTGQDELCFGWLVNWLDVSNGLELPGVQAVQLRLIPHKFRGG